jgi:hypothetical protein
MGSRSRIVKALERLERQVSDQQLYRGQDEERQAAEQRRWEEVVACFGRLLPEDLCDRVVAALQDGRCPLWGWLDNLARGRSRLPECLPEGVMRRLVLIRLDEADRCEPWEAVCLRCGLQYPVPKHPLLSEWRLAPGCSPEERPLHYDLPRLFDHGGCPACGASSRVGEMNWAHLVEDGYWFAS